MCIAVIGADAEVNKSREVNETLVREIRPTFVSVKRNCSQILTYDHPSEREQNATIEHDVGLVNEPSGEIRKICSEGREYRDDSSIFNDTSDATDSDWTTIHTTTTELLTSKVPDSDGGTHLNRHRKLEI